MTGIILFNKPYGVLSQFTDERQGTPRPTLAEFIDAPGFYPAGRLDFDSEGLMVLCDDGRTQARIADPRFKLPKTYLAQVEGLRLTITEGRNRQVRRMTAAVGHPTLRLVRWSVGEWTLDGLAPGTWRRV